MSEGRRLRAAEWAERLADGPSEADRRAFERWSADGGNARAYRDAAHARRTAAGLADAPELQEHRRDALARAARRALRPRTRRPALAAAAAVAIAVALPFAVGGRGAQERIAATAPGSPAHRAPAYWAPTYRTGVGQKLEVALADGSRLTLDTATRVRVAYTARERRLMVEAGQAMFEVAEHQSRPFVVEAGGQEVVAHGTTFSVRLDAAEVRVALVEGSVSVTSRGGGSVAMRPADVLTAGPAGVSVRRDAPDAIAALTSWREGLVVVEDRPLSEVVAEMNRYAFRPVAVDEAAGRIRISGSFRAGEAEPFVEALRLGFPVEVGRRADGTLVIFRR